MSDSYADADPDEIVTVVGLGPMSLRNAIRRYVVAREEALGTAGVVLPLIARETGKDPPSFDVNDLDELAEMERFR